MRSRSPLEYLRLTALGLGFALLLATSGVAGALPAASSCRKGASRLAMEGHQLSQEQAQGLEAALQAAPEDLSIRAKLIGYYCGQFGQRQARQACQLHVLWVIRNHPEAELAGTHYFCLLQPLDGEACEQAAKLWKQQTARHPTDPSVLGNAAAFFLLGDATLTEELLKKGEALEPANPRWPERLGQVYSLYPQPASEPHAARRDADALAAYERAYARTAGDLPKSYLLSYLAASAFDAGSLDKAKAYAELALDAARRWPSDWNAGNAVHHGNLILGRLALRAGDTEKAKAYLISAAKLHGSPQLDSFGPNMVLAKELLERGEQTAVLEYLALCGNFWGTGHETLRNWTATINGGGTPDFGANLSY